ncbi:unnamed protein product [Bursaphelenchus okinawaensis]|uniref:Transthyretin-like family protein n=1 Tax=Bursaphelenchus okinawaensis TaxID=465554 RepID=A0A811L6L1_9BILA|nr:unnamed protein product [Bursaphelenchus okinawaensis]CAG9119139.1 unnamed protein product [Bursaphelenchus okinawaensis]
MVVKFLFYFSIFFVRYQDVSAGFGDYEIEARGKLSCHGTPLYGMQYVTVQLYDDDRFEDDLLGEEIVDVKGYFHLVTETNDWFGVNLVLVISHTCHNIDHRCAMTILRQYEADSFNCGKRVCLDFGDIELSEQKVHHTDVFERRCYPMRHYHDEDGTWEDERWKHL